VGAISLDDGAVRAVRDQGVDMWVPMEQRAEDVDGGKHARAGVVLSEHGAIDLEDRLPGEAVLLAQQAAVEAEEDPQALGNREDKLSVGHRRANVTGDVLGDDEGPLLVTARAEAAAPAGEGDEERVAARGVAGAGEAFVQISTGGELLDGPRDERTPDAADGGPGWRGGWTP
jgi:hypothetical protein